MKLPAAAQTLPGLTRIPSVIRFSLLLAALPLAVEAGVRELDSEVRGHVFLATVEGGDLPIVDAGSRGVQVRRPDGELIWTKARTFRGVEKDIPCAGRVVVFDQMGLTSQDVYGDAASVGVSSSTSFAFTLQADRDLKDVYAAIFTWVGDDDQPGVCFGRLGDLEAGQRCRREARFPVYVGHGVRFRYRFEFYTNGRVVEIFPIDRIATDTRSKNLGIPFEDRLKAFLESAREKNLSGMPVPFTVGFAGFPKEQCRKRGIEEFRVSLLVRADGSLELGDLDPCLTKTEIRALDQEIRRWEFFPALEEGKPVDQMVSFPVRL